MTSDTELWKRGCAGDADAFGDLYGRHPPSPEDRLFVTANSSLVAA
jgi:hypothetical protein